MKTVFLSCHTNDLQIRLQQKSIQKFFKTPFEQVAINDPSDTKNAKNHHTSQNEKIQSVCKELNVVCLRVPQDLHNHRDRIFEKPAKISDHDAGSRHAVSTQYGFQWALENHLQDYIFLIDCDMFFIDHFDIDSYMLDCSMAQVSQSRGSSENGIEQMWPNIFVCNPTTLKDLDLLSWEGGGITLNNENILGDVGTQSQYQLCSHKDSAKQIVDAYIDFLTDEQKTFPHYELLLQFDHIPNHIKPIPNYMNKEILLNYSVIHIRGGSNWCNHKLQYHQECVRVISEYIDMK